MTKTIKKGFIVLLMLVASLFFAFAAGTGFNSVSADAIELTQEQKDFRDNFKAFKTYADANEDGELSNDEIVAVKGVLKADDLFVLMYSYYINAGAGLDNADAEFVAAKNGYNAIYKVYNDKKAVELYSEMVSSVYQVWAKTTSNYTNSVDVVKNARASWEVLYNNTEATKDVSFLKNKLTMIKDVNDAYIVAGAEEIVPENLAKAEAKLAEFAKTIRDAINAIKKIQVVNNAVDPKVIGDVFDGTNYLENYTVVRESKASIYDTDKAHDLVAKVENQGDLDCLKGYIEFDGVTLNHYDIYQKACKSLSDLDDIVKGVAQTIYSVYARFAKYDTCYSIYEDKGDVKGIKSAEKAYNDLAGYNCIISGVNVNDLQADFTAGVKITVNGEEKTVTYAQLKEMTDAYAEVKTWISEAVAAINNIGITAVDKVKDVVKYNNASKEKIAAAQKEFDELPADVKNAASEYVEGYDKFVAAKEAWASYVAEIDALVAAIDKLRGIETNPETSKNIFAEFIAMDKLRTELSDKDNQLAGDSVNGIKGVNSSAVTPFTPKDYTFEITTCAQAYDYFLNLINDIRTATTPISNAISALKTEIEANGIRFTKKINDLYLDIIRRIEGLKREDNTLDDRYIGAIDGYSDFNDDFKPAYENLIEKAEAWIAIIVNKTPITVLDFENIVASTAMYDELVKKYPGADDAVKKANLENDLAACDFRSFKVGETEKNYQGWYSLYTAGLARKAAIIAATDALKTKIEGLTRPALADVIDSTKTDAADYETAVAAVTDDYVKLASEFDNGIAGDITQNYFQTNYTEAYEKYQKELSLVNANAVEQKIALISEATATGNCIAGARTAYDTYLEGTNAAEEDIRNKEDLTEAEATVQGFVNAVNALLNKAAYGSDDKIEADKVGSTLATDYDTLDKIKAGVYDVDISDGTGALKLLNQYGSFTSVMQAYEYGTYNVQTAKELLDKIISIVGKDAFGKLGVKLDKINTLLGVFVSQYKAGLASDYEYKDLYALGANLHSSQLEAIIINWTDFEAISKDKALAEEITKAIEGLLDVVENDKITNETVIDYHIINSIYQNLNPSQKLLVADGKGAENLKTIKTQIDAAMNVDNPTVIDIAAKLAELEKSSKDLDDAIKALAKASDVSDNKAAIAANKNAIDELKEAKADIDGQIETIKTTLRNLADKDTELAGKIDNIVKETDGTIDKRIAEAKAAVKSDYEDADSKLKQTLEDADKAIKEALEKEIKVVKEALEATIKAEKEAREAAIKTETEAREAAVKAANDAREAAIKAEAEAREAAVKAANEAREAETKKLHNAIVTISIIFSIVMVALAACVFVLFLKKKA